MRVPRRATAPFSPREYEGNLDAAGLRLAIVCARWNPTITDALLASSLEALRQCGARAESIAVARVPGAFEVPAGARAMLDAGKYDALIALAAIVRGDTTHHEVLGHSVAHALASLSVESAVPLGFGVLTCDTMEQARERTGKGAEAAQAAVAMANLRRRLRSSPNPP